MNKGKSTQGLSIRDLELMELCFKDSRTASDISLPVCHNSREIISDVKSVQFRWNGSIAFVLNKANTLSIDSVYQELVPGKVHVLTRDSNGLIELDGHWYATVQVR